MPKIFLVKTNLVLGKMVAAMTEADIKEHQMANQQEDLKALEEKEQQEEAQETAQQ